MFTSLFAVSLLFLDTAFGASHVQLFRRSPPKQRNTIVQLFEWPWDSVASECTSFLGPAGYGYVQVSPASEHITGSQWWTDYQTVSYILTSKRGNRAQFANMVTKCANTGVGVIVDVVLNHMTSGSGTGFAGSKYSKYNYPAVPYNASQFHYCNGNTAADISNYNDAHNVRFCELSGLADLAQEQLSVRNTMAAFLNDLLSLGVAGFRVDAAKHMLPADLSAITGLLHSSAYATQEVIFGAGEAVQPSQYTSTGDVIEFRAPASIKTYFTGSPGIAALVTPSPMGAAWGFVDSSVANYIMANQDTVPTSPLPLHALTTVLQERSGTSLTSQSANNAYLLSAIFMLGFNYGTPTVYSGYDFSSFDAGAPQDAAGQTNPVTCAANGWRCEHRWPAIANMNAFHNTVRATTLTNIFKGTSQQIGFGRGALGFLIINNDNSLWTNTWATSLPAGTYCDIIHDTNTDPAVCNGPSYVVSASGTFTASVAPHDALAIFTASLGTAMNTTSSGAASTAVVVKSTTSPAAASTVTLSFVETATVAAGETVKLAGSIAQLGMWAPAAALALTRASAIAPWALTLTLPPSTSFEYKFIKTTASGGVTWEAGANRVYTAPGTAGASVTLYGAFGSTGSSSSAITAAAMSTTSSTPSTSTSTSIAGWTYLGCYPDSSSARTLASLQRLGISVNSVSSCLTACAGAGYAYGGVEFGNECFCVASIKPGVVPGSESKCSYTCSGGVGTCGGFNAINIYHATPIS
ncbi:glycoside hydrolase superfamily [Mycena rosella]|uniref:Alpha-amylase n=1 Tax=Mycena rosella TaxID=1033263 RepID=A0AAD7CZ07_MYCRO|nr:glycoside hydrolase superfamily [Mycena rosella]